ncbi:MULTISPECIES: hypothetical protein [unclassified Janthinobacterium]|uniref:hypothetical protein n=1 Tax=unclassified Janthinobacterium TaxID=2610881 RepID=UPI0002EF8E78|nr:hypothetical protein [Janthinobacterium sp. CG_23.4]MDH6158764.1 hypothetical protein [Janthinobacterium sp. CG_23.4]
MNKRELKAGVSGAPMSACARVAGASSRREKVSRMICREGASGGTANDMVRAK